MAVLINGVKTGGGLSYTDFIYEADLASAATYTPPASTFWGWRAESISSANVNVEWYDAINTGWVAACTSSDAIYQLYQGANQRYRVINDAGLARAIGLYGFTWS